MGKMAIKRDETIIGMTRRSSVALGALALTLSGCGVYDHYRDPEPTFNLAAQATYLQAGLGGVKGVVSAGEPGASPQTCVGHQIYLIPDTPYFQYKARRIAAGDDIADVGLEEDRLDHLVRHLPCPPNGSYDFESLPDAPWIIITTLSAPKGSTGAPIGGHVTTESGITKTVNLDQSNLLKK
jgi:hypothetical protein